MKKYLKQFLLLGVLIVFIGFFYNRCDGFSNMSDVPEISSTASVLDLSMDFKDINGDSVQLSSDSKDVYVINFWATWCGPCRAEIPGLEMLHNKYSSRGLRVIGVAVDGDVSELQTFVSNYGVTYPIVKINESLLSVFGRIRSVPTTFIVDRQYRLVYKILGYESRKSLEQRLIPLLKEET